MIGVVGSTTQHLKQIKHHLRMTDGPAGLRIAKVYYIDEKGKYKRLSTNTVFRSNFVYSLWMGDAIAKIPFVLSTCVCLYVCIMLCGSLMASFLNGAGYLKLQFINCTIAPFIFVGLSYIY